MHKVHSESASQSQISIAKAQTGEETRIHITVFLNLAHTNFSISDVNCTFKLVTI